MNAAQLAKATTKDTLAKSITATFFGAGGSQIYNGYCATAVKATGANPSYFLSSVPLKSFASWDMTSGVALLRGVASTVKLLARGSAGYVANRQRITLVNGWLVSDSHQSPEDSIVQQVFDDRHIMASYFTCFGKMVYDPSRTKHYFISNPNDPLEFNKNGWGDCLDSPFGPRFAPGYRYGHEANGMVDPSSEPAPGAATAKTRKWRVSDILIYLRDFFYEVGHRPPLGQKFGLMELPRQYLDWPVTLGSVIVENKCPQGWRLEGKDLLGALCLTLNYAGPYELKLAPQNATTSRLEVVDFSPRANRGMKIYSPAYFSSLDACAGNPQVAAEFHIKRSALGYAHNTVLTGDASAIEVMGSTDGLDTKAFALGLVTAADAAEIARFKAAVARAPVAAGGDPKYAGDSMYFDWAGKEYPSVFSWFRWNNEKTPFILSKFGDRDESGNFRLKPHQLTSYNGVPASTLGLVPREIVVEIKMTDYEVHLSKVNWYTDHQTLNGWRGPWLVASRYSELALSPDGRYVMLPGLRDQVQLLAGSTAPTGTWVAEDIKLTPNDQLTRDENGVIIPFPRQAFMTNAANGTPYAGAFMRAREVRIQLVCESDHCITSIQGQQDDPNRTAAHIDPGAPQFSLLLRKPPLQYVDWLRSNWSFPVGAAYDQAIRNIAGMEYQPAQAAGKELFTDHIGDNNLSDLRNRLDINNRTYLSNHKRIVYEGEYHIAMLTPLYDVGMLVTFEAPNSLPDVTGVIKCVVFDSRGQSTKLEIGPPAFSTLWNGPLSAVFYGTGGTGAPPPYVEPTDKYDKPFKESTANDTAKKADDRGYETQGEAQPAPDKGKEQPAPTKGEAQPAQKAKKTLTKRENRQKNIEAAAAKGDERARRVLERQADKKAQLANKGGITWGGKQLNVGVTAALLGESKEGGGMTWGGKTLNRGLTESLMGESQEGGSMTLGGKTITSGELKGEALLDTSKADAWANKRNAGVDAADKEAQRASMQRFSETKWGGAQGHAAQAPAQRQQATRNQGAAQPTPPGNAANKEQERAAKAARRASELEEE